MKMIKIDKECVQTTYFDIIQYFEISMFEISEVDSS